MRLERLTANKIKIFLTSDDLMDRGLTKEDIWKDSSKWNQLFHDMLEEASLEFNVDIKGSVAVEVFSLQAQGMIMIITVEESIEDDDIIHDGFIEMQVRVGGYQKLLFEFSEFDDLLGAVKRLSLTGLLGGSIFHFRDCYYLLMDQIDNDRIEGAACIMSEFGHASIISPYVLREYGKMIIKNTAIETLQYYFS
ncbi:adaptor protein MecA [Bacillus rubiinfantis]|uniref:adaptor protein MecA n=1 Tax=Bacillus rubiinfantis TaxID=1499680 RepID=UPI0005A6FCA8|nr:adaptor protein MecA [Bacillus rubiinfantis]